MRFWILHFLVLIIFSPLFSQFNEIQTTKIGIEDLPFGIKVKGKIVEIFRWDDKNGTNYFISSAIGPHRKRFEDHEDEVSKQIFAEQYVIKNDSLEILWNFDLKLTCQMNLELLIIPNSVCITDLDKNGVTETTFVYKTANRSDVSPADIELIMHENKNIFSLKGKTFIRCSEHLMDIDFNDYELSLENITDTLKPPYLLTKEYGRYINDDDFANSPNIFLQFAIHIWKKHIEEKC
ncbi:MAG TPA: hypothetical protein PLK90_06845 [Clostridiales bacterium]|nr:hypothetical protein [Clostridiales bacterium]HQP70100.1 hypothetical protein [Clostridiales bacterium]